MKMENTELAMVFPIETVLLSIDRFLKIFSTSRLYNFWSSLSDDVALPIEMKTIFTQEKSAEKKKEIMIPVIREIAVGPLSKIPPWN
jgi:hypothetical protein